MQRRAAADCAKEFGLGLVAANDVHFLERSHHEAHDVMICIGTGKMVQDEAADALRAGACISNRRTKCARFFRDFPEAISNTVAIAERCNLELEFGRSKYPEYPAPEGKTREAYLRELCYQGLHERSANAREPIRN